MRKPLVVLVLALAALAVAGPAHAAGSKTFADPSGDGGQGPDVTQLVVSNDDAGQLTFAFTFSNRPTILTGDDIVVLAIDADRRGNTGDPSGYEFLFGFLFEGSQVEVGQWDGGKFNFDAPQTTLRSADGGRTVSINRRELGNVASFDFRVVTQGYDQTDTMPEGGGVMTYELALRPQIISVRAAFIPGAPRAGRAFAVAQPTLRLSSGQDVAPASYSCTATLAGKALRAVARCRWNLPRNARGKRLVVTITAGYGGVTARFAPYVFTVRA